jgi:hypothetical protein
MKLETGIVIYLILHCVNYHCFSKNGKHLNSAKISDPLWDIVHSNHTMLADPKIFGFKISDIGILLFFLPLVTINLDSDSLSLFFTEYITKWLALMSIRAITSMVTLLPSSNKKCKPDDHHFFFGGCFDKVFSGHTITVLLAILLMAKYGITSGQKYLLHLFAGIYYCYYLIASRNHYSVDVILSIVLTFMSI